MATEVNSNVRDKIDEIYAEIDVNDDALLDIEEAL
jgi:hypothetical protein